MPTALGRYVLADLLASGGMASVHLGRMRGPGGFGRTVAIKRLHPQLACDSGFVAMMLDEARVASRIHHPNVVPTLDVVHSETDLYLVLEYVAGETLSSLLRRLGEKKERIPLPVTRAIIGGVLAGLHAAHELKDAEGQPLGVVHRDVSPHNIMVGADGVPRVLDFGIAKATSASHQTDTGEVKGKVAYMAPEQRLQSDITPTADIYAVSVVLWEMLTGTRLFEGTDKRIIAYLALSGAVRKVRSLAPDVPEDLETIVMQGLELEAEKRWTDAHAMLLAIEATGPVATAREVAAWLADVAGPTLADRAAKVARMEKETVLPDDRLEIATTIAKAANRPGSGTDEAALDARGFSLVTETSSSIDRTKARQRTAAYVIAGSLVTICALGAAAIVVRGTLLRGAEAGEPHGATSVAATAASAASAAGASPASAAGASADAPVASAGSAGGSHGSDPASAGNAAGEAHETGTHASASAASVARPKANAAGGRAGDGSAKTVAGSGAGAAESAGARSGGSARKPQPPKTSPTNPNGLFDRN